jgi:hypothetical protein
MNARHLAVGALLLAACSGHQHLWDGRGAAYRGTFAAQRATRPPGAKRSQAATGLDSQEAAIIADAYRASLAPKGTKMDQQPVLVVSPQGQGQQQYAVPPPSVPRE